MTAWLVIGWLLVSWLARLAVSWLNGWSVADCLLTGWLLVDWLADRCWLVAVAGWLVGDRAPPKQ